MQHYIGTTWQKNKVSKMLRQRLVVDFMGAPLTLQVVADAYAQRVELDADGLTLAVDGLDDGRVEIGVVGGGGSGGGCLSLGHSIY